MLSGIGQVDKSSDRNLEFRQSRIFIWNEQKIKYISENNNSPNKY